LKSLRDKLTSLVKERKLTTVGYTVLNLALDRVAAILP
jgi:hypothetical protein